ncbi:hypothetical protein [Mesonia sp. K4-1]|uniref:hypothetical protein n=1 Tax=Mesonia sp. K4-1 TaxID=2602760 RepID=UPI0011C80F33|nr:hypothetical protein [Mesonia sp. K4-1]TXK78908.1 hypothetical protein FT986_03670 [Mesonia sp. K4-1]
MAYKILYIDDQNPESRKKDFESIGFEVITHKPTNDFKEIEIKVKDGINALILDYKLTAGDGDSACFDAPTIAQFVRTIHVKDTLDIPIILMSNQTIYINNYKKDFTSQDLFDFTITKQEFTSHKKEFGSKLKSFIKAYSKIKSDKSLLISLGLDKEDKINSRITLNLGRIQKNIYKVSSLIYEDIISSIGLTIGEDVLAARLGISLNSPDWHKVLYSLKESKYTGVFSDIKDRWWMEKINVWWEKNISSDTPIRRLNAEERVQLIIEKLNITELKASRKTKFSNSSNFWTICKHSKKPIDPFDGVELIKDYLSWQEKEYLSIDSALISNEKFKNQMSKIDKKMIRELAKKLNADE